MFIMYTHIQFNVSFKVSTLTLINKIPSILNFKRTFTIRSSSQSKLQIRNCYCSQDIATSKNTNY